MLPPNKKKEKKIEELKVDEYISLESDSEVENIDLTSAWDTKKPL